MSKKIGLAAIVLALAGGMVLTGCNEIGDPALWGTWSYEFTELVDKKPDVTHIYTLEFSSKGTLTFGGAFLTDKDATADKVAVWYTEEESGGADIPLNPVVAYTAKDGTLTITGNGSFGAKTPPTTYTYKFESGKLVITDFFKRFLKVSGDVPITGIDASPEFALPK
jgi:hypothetical protein